MQGFLADTWWYALTARMTDEDFRQLAKLRAAQGFNAVQLVVGIPPETTPEDPNAASPYGPAWERSGAFNHQYLRFASERISFLNQSGLTVIVYGAWGPQVGWLGVDRMIYWWQQVIETTRGLDVRYCLTGESNLLPGLQDFALFNRQPGLVRLLEKALDRSRFTRRARNILFGTPAMLLNRRHAWSIVLRQVAQMTDIPIIIHPNPRVSGFDCVENPELLAANTVQTGHSEQSRPYIHRQPLEHYARKDYATKGFINLEPWYEGILDKFRGVDQLYAYWVSMLAGAISHCYGAHGVWNAGDGNFLNHWGAQTLAQAMALDTPRLLGLSHQLFKPYISRPARTIVDEDSDSLISIARVFDNERITFIPEVSHMKSIPPGRAWIPIQGRFIEKPPANGQVVLFCDR